MTKWSQNDAYPSVLALNRTDGNLYYYRNSAGRALAPRTLIGEGWQGLKTVSLDFDGDGRMDVLAQTPDGLLKLYRSNGSGRFISEPRRVIGTGWNGMDHISAITNHLGDGQSGILARDFWGSCCTTPCPAVPSTRGASLGRTAGPRCCSEADRLVVPSLGLGTMQGTSCSVRGPGR